MTQQITAAAFRAATGDAPENDDLERANCPTPGTIGHHFCGWDEDANLPRWMSGNPLGLVIVPPIPED